ncbi:dipeptide/oligopeptide/nickel ABC transporter permease/ATP-binding protein [Actinoplanes sp. NPDC051851]|uniref:dipeptide/oligopeptide/nickel ABC transporter permease/ATP-binding protein n=1 Tax=Actinoplanes sp. NPDC051851 TaxID=3154753 RepID=UPI003430FD86
MSATPEGLGSPLRAALLRVLRRPSVLISLGWLFLITAGTAGAGFLAPYDPLDQDLNATLALPSGAHWLGTDDLGRDLLSRLLHGGGGVLAGALEAVVVAVVIGVPAGLFIGYVGGIADRLGNFVTNVMFAVPAFVVLLTVAFITENDIPAIMGVLGVMMSGGLTRLIRASTQSARDLLYVDAARVADLPRTRILRRHILPNVTGPLLVQTFFLFSVAFVILTSLSFLGLGFSPETPNWGQMVLEATQRLGTSPWLMVPIGGVLIFTVLALNHLGSALRDALPQAERSSLLLPRPSSRTRNRAEPRAQKADRAEATGERSAAADVLLAVDGLTVSVGDLTLVDGVSLTLRRGGVLGLVGESGCGKTMTALALAGLVPPPVRVGSRSMRFDGTDVRALTPVQRERLRGREIGLVSQEPMVALDPCFTVGATLVEALRLHRRLSRSDARTEALTLLRQVGIAAAETVYGSYPHQLSGGMAQRVCIALALTGRPKLLIADEPTTALDVTIQAEILDLLRAVQDEFGTTIIIVTHDLGVVADLCTDVAVMYAGQVIESGTVDQVLADPAHPYTRGLLAATPDLRVPGERLRTIAGTVPVPAEWPAHCRFANRCPHAQDGCTTGPILLELVTSTPDGPAAGPNPAAGRGEHEHASRCRRTHELEKVE